ncbi:probable UDP-N-acetylglucosamine-peptide N-acetylglucosam [Coccomyxa sp. Obi]|nr:probable UDP-N-acetylglucosamine-peptide N-acetylglucosam [Coccomyxa sp. Obi]
MAQMRNEADREEGRVTDDEHASCSDHVSVEGGIGSDTSRPGSGTWDVSHLPESFSPDANCSEGEPTAWSYPTFAFTASDPQQEKGISQADDEQQIKLARLLLSRGKAKEALSLLDQASSALQPDVATLCLRGQCCSALGNNAVAFACFSNALSIDPRNPDTLLAAASLYKSCGLLPEAARSLELALEERPDDTVIRQALAVVLTDLGTKLKVSGRLEEGFAKYRQAASICDNYAPAFYNIGVIHSERREFGPAKELYARAIRANPSYAEAHCNLGVIHKEEGRLDEAIASYERALAIAPEFAIVSNNLAIALTEMGTRVKVAGDMAGGIALYERALTYNAKHADALYNLGVACGETGQIARAIFLYELAIHFNPSCAEAWNNLGVLQRDMGNFERAFSCYQAALQLRPNFPQGLNNLAVIFTAQGRAQDALQMLQAAIAAAPDYAEAYNNLGVLQREVGAIKEALASYTKCLELAPTSRNAGQNRLLALNYIYEDTAAAHEDWGAQFQKLFEPLPPDFNARFADLERPLVVGYVSPDLFTHSVSYFAEAPLSHHKQSRVRHIVYSCVPRGDSKTVRLRAAVEAAGGLWRDVAALSESDLAHLARADGVDILVDLTGHTANNRLGTFAMRPAPLQVTWIGYPNSTGLRAVDFRLTDAVADPLDTRQRFVEELVRLPGCFLCYTPAIDAPPVAPLPAAAAGFVTFGSFNNLAKITPRVMAVWARILNALPSSRLVLKNKPFACTSARSHVLGQLQAAGVDGSRVDLLPLAAANADHLATYALMDISLDPFPYAGTTTTCESLYMGVPVITLAGGCHAHNVGVSLLDAIGMREGWVAQSEDEYVRLAVAAAADIAKLAALRGRLRMHMLSSRMCDAPTFVRQLEDVYRQLWLRRAAVSRGAAAGPAGDGAAEGRVGRQHSAPVPDACAAAWEAAQSDRAATS